MGWGKWSRGRCGSLGALGSRNEGGRRSVHGERRLAGLGARRRGNSGGFWATRSGWEAALGRGAANGGGYWGGAGLWWRLRGGVSSPGFGEVRRRRSDAWERGESKRAIGIGFWDIFRARALARRGRRALQRAFHGGVAVAAAWAALEAAGRVARPGKLQREATGGGGALERRVGASPKQRDGREGSPRRRRAALSVDGGEKQSREVEDGDKGRFAISENSRDHSVNKQ